MGTKCGGFQGSVSYLTSGDPLGGGRGERVRLAPGGVRMGTLGCEPRDSGGKGECRDLMSGEARVF